MNSCKLYIFIWRPSSLSELTLIIFSMELTHLGWDAFIFELKEIKYFVKLDSNKKHSSKFKLGFKLKLKFYSPYNTFYDHFSMINLRFMFNFHLNVRIVGNK